MFFCFISRVDLLKVSWFRGSGKDGPCVAPTGLFFSFFIVIIIIIRYFFFSFFPLSRLLGELRTRLLSSLSLPVILAITLKVFGLRNLPDAALYTFTWVGFFSFGFSPFLGVRWALWPSFFLVKLTVCHSVDGAGDVLVDAP